MGVGGRRGGEGAKGRKGGGGGGGGGGGVGWWGTSLVLSVIGQFSGDNMPQRRR